MNRRRALIAVGVFAAAAALLYQLQREQRSQLPAAVPTQNTPRYAVDDATWTRFDGDGIASLRGHFAHAEYFADGSGDARELSLTALSLRGAPWIATAPAARLPAHGDRVQLLGTVTINGRWPDNGEPLRLTTSQLWLVPEAHQLYGDAPVLVEGAGRSASARGVRGDWALQDLELLSDVRMRYDVPPR